MADNAQEPEINLDNYLNQDPKFKPNTPPAGDPPAPKGSEGNEPPVPSTPPTTSAATPPNDPPSGDTEVKVKDFFVSLNNEDDLTEENRALKSKLLEKYKGKGFNTNGDIVNESNEVVKAFADVLKDISSDEDENKLDAEGNLLDDEGKIVKTKAQLDAESSAVNVLHQKSGFEFKNEDGSIKTYEDSDEGLFEFANDVAEHKAMERQNNFISSNPTLMEVAKHLLAGKPLDTFQQTVDYSKVDTAKLSEAEKIAYIKQSFKLKNYSDERIAINIKRIKDGSQVDDELKFALGDLKDHQKEIAEQRQADFEAAELAKQEKAERYWTEVENTIKKGELKEMSISNEDKDKFFDYLTKPVKGNLTQADLDSKAISVQEDLTLRFLQFKGYNLGELVKNKANTLKVNGLRDLINRSAKVKLENYSNKGTGNSKPKDITLDMIVPK